MEGLEGLRGLGTDARPDPPAADDLHSGRAEPLLQLRAAADLVELRPSVFTVLVVLALLPWLLGRWITFAAALIESIPERL